MLVLRRRPGEAIVLNGVVKVVVLSIEGDRIKLGFVAPPDVVIVREELLMDAERAMQAASQQGVKPDA